jgi:hypothetical protein
MIRVFRVIARRNQEFDGLAEEIFAIVAEQFLYLSIDQDDCSVLVHYDKSIRSGFQKCPKSLLRPTLAGGALLQFLHQSAECLLNRPIL